jgi:tRNA(Ile)-lysidine synthase
LETFNPRAVEALGRAAALLREDSAALEHMAVALLEEARAETDVEGRTKVDGRTVAEVGEGIQAQHVDAWPVRVEVLTAALPALRSRALRLWLARGRGDLRRLSRAHLDGVERLLAGTRGGRVAELPGGSSVERRRGLLLFREKE